MGALKVLDKVLGDKKVTWDKGKQDEVDVARREFDYLVKEKGYAAYKVDRKGKKVENEIIRTFDPTLEEVILIPQKVGG